MPLTPFPHGISSYGIPILGSSGLFPRIPDRDGQVYFVDGGKGSDNNDGLTKDRAFATIGQFHTRATSGQGDRAYIYPGTYTEAVTITKTGLTLISAGGLDSNVGVTWGAASASVPCTVTAGTGFSAIGIFFSGTAAIACLQQANSYYYRNCRFTSSTTDGLVLRPNGTLANGTAAGGRVKDCEFADNGDAGINFDDGTSETLGLGVTDVKILGCSFQGNTGDDMEDTADTAGTDTLTDVLIAGNLFLTRNKSVYLDLNQGDSVRVLIAGNFFADDAGLDSTKISLATGAVFSGNFDAVGVRDGSGF